MTPGETPAAPQKVGTMITWTFGLPEMRTTSADTINLITSDASRQFLEALKGVIAKNPRLTDAWTHLARTYESMGAFPYAPMVERLEAWIAEARGRR